MKRLWMICMACLLCLSLQAEISHKRVVECPAFVTANTSEIEIRKITLTDEQTQVDAVFMAAGNSCRAFVEDLFADRPVSFPFA